MHHKLPFFKLFFLLLSAVVWGQVTTASLTGNVKDQSGKNVSGIVLEITNPSIGYVKTTTTSTEGLYVVNNLQVGGPYVVKVASANYEAYVSQELFLNLGKNDFNITISSKSMSKNIDEVVITKKSNNTANGVTTNIGSNVLKALPTISRSTDDYLRLTPSASETFNGLSFAGRNGQYNNFSLDGAVFNNPFGLDSPTPGGQTSATPISLDAIEQIQVNIAPYDVTQAGFTGAGINSVTKSGKNKTFGTAYFFYRNNDMVGNRVDGNKIAAPRLSSIVQGASLGGALIKNKLFYFLNYEFENREDGATNYVARNNNNQNDVNASRVMEADIVNVRNILKNVYGYETGAYQGYTFNQNNVKWIGKLDWNINADHKISFTYNGLDAVKGKPAHPSAIGRRGPDFTTLQFQNSGYEINNQLNSFIGEYNANFGAKITNKLRAVYTQFKDFREPLSSPFPSLNITKNGVRYIIAGHEPFSIHNRLNQKALQITNNTNISLNKHMITLGLSYEMFKFENSFNLTGYGPALFGEFDINDFISSNGNPNLFGFIPFASQVNFARTRAQFNDWTWYGLNVGQFSAYAQDDFKVSDKLNIVYGIRIDKPIYGDSYYRSPNINDNGTFAGSYTTGTPTVANNDNLTMFDENGRRITNGVGKDVDNTSFPTAAPLFSPRVGFTYDVHGDKSVIVRGGSGLFTGRFPFVWLGNQIGNPFSFFYNVTAKNFKWPQVWRSNLGLDYKIKSTGTNISGDVSYTKDVNGMMVRNYRFGRPTGTLNSGTGDNRAFYTAQNQGTDNVYAFSNTNVGYQFNATFQVMQDFRNNFFGLFGYNYLVSKDASSVSAEISSDAFDRNPVNGDVNSAVLSNSLYGNTHRFVYAVSKKFNTGTTISFFGSSNSGNRFSYVYGGDINNDGVGTNDLMYIPTSAEINNMNFTTFRDALGNAYTPAQQRAALEAFINQDDYLSGRRGKFAEKYAGVSPWLHQLDLRILQDVKVLSKAFQLSLDIINFGNMINSAWGVRRYATTSGYFQPVAVSLNNNTPSYQFDPNLKTAFVASPELNSRWQMQLGVRFSF